MEKTYIYVIGQFDDEGELMFSESFKIGKADNLKQRFDQEYKKNTGYIHPKYIRVLEKIKKHNAPDKPLHAYIDEFTSIDIIQRKSKHKELYRLFNEDSLSILDRIFKTIESLDPNNKYYTEPQEIYDLERNIDDTTIISATVNSIINEIIFNNSDNSENEYDCLENHLLNENLINDNLIFLKEYIEKACLLNPPAESNKVGYTKNKNIELTIKNIRNFEQLKKSILESDKQDVIAILKETHINIKKSIFKKEFTNNYPGSIVKCLIKLFECLIDT